MLPSDWPLRVGCRLGFDLLAWMLPSTLENTLFLGDLRQWSVGDSGSTIEGGDPCTVTVEGGLRF